MNNDHVFHLDCGCGCGGWRIAKDDDSYYLEHYAKTFYSMQESGWKRMAKRIQFAWYALTGKSFRLSDIVIAKEDMKRFREFVNQDPG